eukprot:scaffold3464_cov406-Prasinococcus_capsulatus_cf.AAC.10
MGKDASLYGCQEWLSHRLQLRESLGSLGSAEEDAAAGARAATARAGANSLRSCGWLSKGDRGRGATYGLRHCEHFVLFPLDYSRYALAVHSCYALGAMQVQG